MFGSQTPGSREVLPDGLRRSGKRRSIEVVIKILDRYLSASKDSRFGLGTVGNGKPEGSGFLIVVNELNALDPERRILGGLSFDADDCIFLGVYPDSAPHE